MHRLFDAMISPLLQATQAEFVLEVGAGSGRLTRRMLEESQANVIAIDPHPGFDQDALGIDGRLTLHARRSLEVLATLPAVDLAMLDGDPNWYTTINELRLLVQTARRADRLEPVMVIHHSRWPFARRDGYHDPDAIPAEWRDDSSQSGLVPWHAAPSAGGLSLVPHVGITDHKPESGVRTAIDDFLAEDSSPWQVIDIPGLFGVAVLVSRGRLVSQPALADVLEGFEGSRFLLAHLDRVERERILALIDTVSDPAPHSSEVLLADSHGSPLNEEKTAAPRSAQTDALTQDSAETKDTPGAQRELLLAQRELDAANSMNSALQWRLQQLEGDRRLNDEQLASERERAAAAEAQRAKLEGQVGELRAHMRTLAQTAEEGQGELERVRDGLEKERAQVGQLQSALERSLEEERLATGRAAHLSEALESSQADASSLRGQVDTAGKQIDLIIREREEIRRQLEALANSRTRRMRRRLAFVSKLIPIRSRNATDRLDSLMATVSQPLPALRTSGHPDSQIFPEALQSIAQREGTGADSHRSL